MDTRHTLKCDIYEFDRLRNRCYIDTPRFNNGVDFLYRLATALEMRLNDEYWCEPECTWQTNSINKTAKSDRLDSWASRHWRGIELVFNSLDCFTVRPIFSTRSITRMKRVCFVCFFVFFLSFFFFFFFLFFFWGVTCSAPMHLLFGAVYRSQGHRGYLDVSKVALLWIGCRLSFHMFLPWNLVPKSL